MDSNFSIFIILILLTTSWYYYSKYKEYEHNTLMLNHNINRMSIENVNYKARIKDLQKYKNDVSKTFKILDNELVHINNHVEKNNQMYSSNQTERLNLLTPDMLNNLIDNMNQEINLFTPELRTETLPVVIPFINAQQPSTNDDDVTTPPPVTDSTSTTTPPVTDSNVTSMGSSIGSTILRSMSFPNLPSAYQRLMIPLSESIISRVTALPTSGNTNTFFSSNTIDLDVQREQQPPQQLETINKEGIKND